jgi:DNA-binding transcriptional ArsR family regulator
MNIFGTLAEPTRRRIIELLADRERSVKELCDQFDISQPAVSRHLRVLRKARLVSSRVDAQRRLYSLEPGPLEEVDRWLDRYRSYWHDPPRRSRNSSARTGSQKEKTEEGR